MITQKFYKNKIKTVHTQAHTNEKAFSNLKKNSKTHTKQKLINWDAKL